MQYTVSITILLSSRTYIRRNKEFIVNTDYIVCNEKPNKKFLNKSIFEDFSCANLSQTDL